MTRKDNLHEGQKLLILKCPLFRGFTVLVLIFVYIICALFCRFVSRKVELMVTEAHVLRLIHIFRGEWFDDIGTLSLIWWLGLHVEV